MSGCCGTDASSCEYESRKAVFRHLITRFEFRVASAGLERITRKQILKFRQCIGEFFRLDDQDRFHNALPTEQARIVVKDLPPFA